MGEFDLNSWVQHTRTSYKGSVVGHVGDYVRVHWFLFSNGRPLNDLTNIDLHLKHELKELPNEPKIFSYDELDIALLTNDEQWFNEIQALKGANQ